MALPTKTDEEIIDLVLGVFYNGGTYQYLNFYTVGSYFSDEDFHTWDIIRLWRKLQDDDWIVLDNAHSDLYKLSDKGMALLRKHGSYLNYLSHIEQQNSKRDTIERNDRRVKNIGILATLAISLLTLILTQFPIRKDKQLQKTEEGIQSVATKLDSLLQVLPPPQTRKER